MMASLCLLYHFTKVGIYILWLRPWFCCVILQRFGNRSYSVVFVFVVSFYKRRNKDLMVSILRLPYHITKAGIYILWWHPCVCCVILQRLGYRSYGGILVFAKPLY